MNFFFGIKSSIFSCKLTVPKFQNFGRASKELSLYEAFPKNNFWSISEVECEENELYFFLDNNNIENNKIFFIAKKNEADYLQKNNQQLLDVSKFTNTSPSAFRSNLKIFIPNKGFSSYQSEYPFDMTTRNGNILSPLNMLLNKEADHNFVFFKNIYFKAEQNKSSLYFIDLKKKKVLKKFEIKQNYLNQITVENEYLKDDVYVFTENCLGIPLYVSVKNSHISFEHTHPPHHYILSEDRYKTVAKIKNEIKDVIN